jgi:hypothetical protein
MVLAPMEAGVRKPDGAFDVIGVGQGVDGGWPDESELVWPEDLPKAATVVVDRLDEGSGPLVRRFPAKSIHSVSSVQPGDPRTLRFTPTSAEDETFTGIEVPINPLAATHRHNGLGFTGYLLVLTDRSGAVEDRPPTDAVAWLTAAFHDAYIVVIEGARAVVWKGRAIRGSVAVDTRTDLWRLLAHARLTIDLAPGECIARECIESLRFKTPIAVPRVTVAASHTWSGGGITFADPPELVRNLQDLGQAALSSMATLGHDYAETHYGDTSRCIDGVATALFG